MARVKAFYGSLPWDAGSPGSALAQDCGAAIRMRGARQSRWPAACPTTSWRASCASCAGTSTAGRGSSRLSGPARPREGWKGRPFLAGNGGRKVPLELFCGTATASAVLTPRVSSENIRFLLDCALEDMGVTLLPSYFTQDMVEAGRLVQLLPQWYSNKNGSKLLIVTLPNRYPIPAAQALI